MKIHDLSLFDDAAQIVGMGLLHEGTGEVYAAMRLARDWQFLYHILHVEGFEAGTGAGEFKQVYITKRGLVLDKQQAFEHAKNYSLLRSAGFVSEDDMMYPTLYPNMLKDF
jgi:hypothetical protein